MIVLFTDESRFSLNTDSRRMLIWREPGNRYLHSNVCEIDNYGGNGLMVQAGIRLDGRTPLHILESSSVTGLRSWCESEDIHRMVGYPDLHTSNQRAYLRRSRESNRNSPAPSANHPGKENSVAVRVGLIATRSGKVPYFKYDITLCCLHSYIRIKNIYCSGKYKSCETSERKKNVHLICVRRNRTMHLNVSRHLKERYQYRICPPWSVMQHSTRRTILCTTLSSSC
ncbi:DDE_3 domain-containing protein [Trichonephila clavipes]|nr:DDE_3 domain-containing protein [Trichonephila clavipes]